MPDQGSETITLRVRKTHLYMAVALLVGFGGGMATMGILRSPASDGPDLLPPAPPSSGPIDVAIEGRPTRGPADAPVTLVEFTDYQCPYCGQHFRETYPELLSRYDGQLRYVVRNFPVRTLHPHAERAAAAAECAHEQERFWEYHDLLFERSPALDPRSLEAYAEEVRLDTERFQQCLEAERIETLVRRDFDDGVAYGVRATPTFFINGHRLVGALPLDQFATLIDAELESAPDRGGQ